FNGGLCFKGKNHCHWTYYCWYPSYSCYCYWCPYSCCYYYWCEPQQCYYPISYITTAPPTTTVSQAVNGQNTGGSPGRTQAQGAPAGPQGAGPVQPYTPAK